MICGLIRSPIARSVRDVVKSAGCVGISATVGAGRAPGVGSYRGHGSVVSRGWRGRACMVTSPVARTLTGARYAALVFRDRPYGVSPPAHCVGPTRPGTRAVGPGRAGEAPRPRYRRPRGAEP